MATLVLAAAGAAAGGAIGGAAFGISAAVWGQALGATLGNVIDQSLFGPGPQTIQRGQLERFRIQNTAEGSEILRIAGRMRIAGQVIWTSGFQESVTTHRQGGKMSPTITTETYSYSSSIALALCEGEITKIGRIWADGKEIDRSQINITVYLGTDRQNPDPVIAGYEKSGNTPAFRGTAYVVIEDFMLGDYGNRIPQLHFEVFRKTFPVQQTRQDPSRNVRAVSLIPGSGEFILGTTPVTYEGEFATGFSANRHTTRGQTDMHHSLEDLQADLPNCKRVSMVLTWYGDDLRCNHCALRPKVEYRSAQVPQEDWTVGGLSRANAQEVGRIDNRPAFGGTPSDQSVIEGIAALKAKNIGVTIYPFIIMDIMKDNKLPNPWDIGTYQPMIPWRGRITAAIASDRQGSPDQSNPVTEQINAFFGAASADDFVISDGKVRYRGPDEWSYRRFILHHCALSAVAGGVDAFCIGSEMRALTQLRDANNGFPAVAQLIALASEARKILGEKTKIGYAADWSEYFGYQPQDGSNDRFFHLDSLWADDNIDFVGIDNYMPISDWRDRLDHADSKYHRILNRDYLASNIEGGEGYDWYYQSSANRDAQKRTEIRDDAHNEPWIYRYKDIRNWWLNHHYERINGQRSSAPTAWLPQSKPIWFTEYGFPAVDKGTNQPNVFVDPKSSETSLPYFSNGDAHAGVQLAGIAALQDYWRQSEKNPKSTVYGGAMIDLDNAYVWAWDARPWPDFPKRNDIWSDGENYRQGHWVTGRINEVSLSDLVAELCEFSGLSDYDSTRLTGSVVGFVIGEGMSIRSAIEQLSQAYQFSAQERDGVLMFEHFSNEIKGVITYEDLVFEREHRLEITQSAPFEAAGRLGIGYWDTQADYQLAVAEVSQRDAKNQAIQQINFSLVLDPQQAQKVAGQLLGQSGAAAQRVTFSLPPSQSKVQIGDIIELQTPDASERLRVVECDFLSVCRLSAVQTAPQIDWQGGVLSTTLPQVSPTPPLPVYLQSLNLPQFRAQGAAGGFFAISTAQPWPNRVAMLRRNGQGLWQLEQIIERAGVLGRTLNTLNAAIPNRWAHQVINLRLSSNAATSQQDDAIFAGANWLAIRADENSDWEILAYSKAELQQGGTYQFSRLLRGLRGTETFIPPHYPIGSQVALLDGAVVNLQTDWLNPQTRVEWLYGPARLPYDHDVYRKDSSLIKRADLRPFAPAHLRVVENDGYFDLRWVRRSRVFGEYWDSLDIPLGEDQERYVITFRDSNKSQTWKSIEPSLRILKTDLQNARLSGDLQVAVAQFSQIYGQGPEIRKMIHV